MSSDTANAPSIPHSYPTASSTSRSVSDTSTSLESSTLPPTTQAHLLYPYLQQCIKALSLNTGKYSEIDGRIIGGAISEIMSGTAPASLVSAFLVLLHPEKFTPNIIAEAAKSMRSHATQFPVSSSNNTASLEENSSALSNVLDIVGTGGDGLDTFNVSTTAAFLIAANGIPVVKHGNRSSSSKCGSADLLEALGAKIDIDIKDAVDVVKQCNFVFLFAQRVHPLMEHVGSIREQLGIKTIFNVVGPLTNPCIPSYQLTGVYDYTLGRLFAESFKQLGLHSAMVVHSKEGMDEISIAQSTHVWHLRSDGTIEEYDVEPLRDFGIQPHDLSEVASGNATENAVTLKAVLSGTPSAQLDHVLINAAAALIAADILHNQVIQLQLPLLNPRSLLYYKQYLCIAYH
jgi:anthranilate phosphoribosyltransferase